MLMVSSLKKECVHQINKGITKFKEIYYKNHLS